MKKSKILYAEDDLTLAFLTKDALEMQSFEITHCKDGQEALLAFDDQRFDICILDIMMPNTNGFEVATQIRSRNADIPILFLSAKTLKEDRIKGLQLGADDYLVKPFSMEELVLKINIFLRRSQKENSILPNIVSIGIYSFDIENYTVSTPTTKVKLTQREAALLQFFIDNKNKVVKREAILKSLWGEDDYFMGRSLDVFISRLRKILINDTKLSIENLHGIGFRFNEKN